MYKYKGTFHPGLGGAQLVVKRGEFGLRQMLVAEDQRAESLLSEVRAFLLQPVGRLHNVLQSNFLYKNHSIPERKKPVHKFRCRKKAANFFCGDSEFSLFHSTGI
jgi:hypothetical protein